MKPFAYDLEERHIKQERQKARDLRGIAMVETSMRQRALSLLRSVNTAAADLTMDHIVPLARGGKTTKGNVVPACKSCNNKKKQLLPMEWETYLQSVRPH